MSKFVMWNKVIYSINVFLILQILYLATLGGHSDGDTVRRVMRKVATNEVLSQYTFHGKKTRNSKTPDVIKMPFKDLRIYRVISSMYN